MYKSKTSTKVQNKIIMIKTTLLLTVLIMCIGLNKSFAQDAKLATGGNATGSNGSASYSVGQINYKEQGVQQPIEIFTVGITKNTTAVQCLLFPNPAVHSVSLTVNDFINSTTYQLLDANSKLLVADKLTSTTTTIGLQNYANGVFYLNVLQKNSIVKSFKLIKNN